MIYLVGDYSRLLGSPLFSLASIQDVLEYFKDKPYVCVDTETQGRDPHSKKILSLQLGDKDNQFVIDCRTIPIHYFKELLESKLCLLHNSKFDYKFLKTADIILDKIYDTMLAECVIYCGYEKFGYSLKHVVQRYCGVELDKETRGEFFKLSSQPFTESQVIYAARDVAYLDLVKDAQEVLINKYKLNYCVALENEAVKALADIEYNGMKLDTTKWLKLESDNVLKLRQIEIELDDILIAEPKMKLKIKKSKTLFDDSLTRNLSINYGSPVQTLKIAHKLGFTEIPSTDDRFVSKYTKKHKYFELLSTWRELNKRVSTYGKGFLRAINSKTGKIHTDFWQVKVTGRVSSGNKETNAPNLQNIPATNDYRNCFVARPGFKWVSADYSQQELMIMIDTSGEPLLIEMLNKGEDIHYYMGSIMFKRPMDKEKDKPIRTKVKTLNFGKAYGMGPGKLADSLNIPLNESYELFDLYAKSFPLLSHWLKSEGIKALSYRRTYTLDPCRRVRWYPQLNNMSFEDSNRIEAEVKRFGPNTVIQGTAANICKEALIGVRNLINEYNNKHNETVAYLICTVHDAIDVEVREDLAEKFSKDMNKVMVEVGNKYVKHVSMKTDITITDYWTK